MCIRDRPLIPGHVVELHRRFRVAAEKSRLPKKVGKKWQWPADSDGLKTARSMVAQYVSEKLIEVEEKASKAAKEALARALELKQEASAGEDAMAPAAPSPQFQPDTQHSMAPPDPDEDTIESNRTNRTLIYRLNRIEMN